MMTSLRVFIRRRWKEMLSVLTASMLNAFLIFSCVLDELGGKDNNLFKQIYETFFHSHQEEVIIGQGVDAVGSFWIVRKVKDMLLGQSPTSLSDIYAPYGYDIALHEGYAWADTLFGIPWEMLIGVPGFYNLHVFQTLCLSFIGMYLLFRVIGLHWTLGLIFAHLSIFHSFGIDEIAYGRPTQIHWIWMSLTTLGMFKMLYGDSSSTSMMKWSLFTGLSMGVSCLVYWFGAVALGFSLAIVFIIELIRHTNWRASIPYGLLAAGTSIVFTLGITWRVSKSILKGHGSAAYNHLSDTNPLDIHIAGLTIPISGIHPIDNVDSVVQLFALASIPPICIILWIVLISTRQSWLKYWPWHIATFFSLGIPMQKAIGLGGLTIPTTYSVLEMVFPPLIRCGAVHRMMIAPTILLMISSALVLTDWMSNHDRHIHKRIRILFAIIMGLNLSYLPTKGNMYTTTFSVKAPLKRYKGGFIDVPFRVSNEEYVQQLWHKQPILGGPGFGTIQSDAHKRYLQRNGILKNLDAIHQTCNIPPDRPNKRDLLQLYKDQFRWIILHNDFLHCDINLFENYMGTRGIPHPRHRITILPLPKLQDVQ